MPITGGMWLVELCVLVSRFVRYLTAYPRD